MVSHEEALRAAVEYLRHTYRDMPYTFVMEPELTTEHREVWAIRFDTEERRDTGDMTKAPFTRLLLVPKDGAEPWFPPSAWSVGEFEAQLGPPQ
ncbi:YrhB domain-containing protein [Streptomyces avicenniae]|uniref:YrhB domain-containing protein n=1 Tax=Streptomyces avicenniae TaxID=500153 RepID=UPI00069C94A6|nr:YrhB domain-containing protein [Streptomyces avicenniae]